MWHTAINSSYKCSPLSLTSLPRTVLSLSPRVIPLVADAEVTRFLMTVTNLADFNTTNLEVKHMKKTGSVVTNSAVTDHHHHIYDNTLHSPLFHQKLQRTWITSSSVLPHIQTTATNAGRLLETPVSAALGTEKEIHCASSACFRSSSLPLHWSRFYSFFCSGLKNSPDFFTLAAAAATHQYGDEDGPRQHWHGDDQNLKVHCTNKKRPEIYTRSWSGFMIYQHRGLSSLWQLWLK